MQKLTEFFAMGGYGAYVWPSFAISGALMLLMAAISLRSLRRTEKALERLQSTGSSHPDSP